MTSLLLSFSSLPTDVILYILHEHYWFNVSRFIRSALALPSDFQTPAFLLLCFDRAKLESHQLDQINIMRFFDETLFLRSLFGRFADGAIRNLYVNFWFGSEHNVDLLVIHSWNALLKCGYEELFQSFVQPWLSVLVRNQGISARRLRFCGFMDAHSETPVLHCLEQLNIYLVNDGISLVVGLEELKCVVTSPDVRLALVRFKKCATEYRSIKCRNWTCLDLTLTNKYWKDFPAELISSVLDCPFISTCRTLHLGFPFPLETSSYLLQHISMLRNINIVVQERAMHVSSQTQTNVFQTLQAESLSIETSYSVLKKDAKDAFLLIQNMPQLTSLDLSYSHTFVAEAMMETLATIPCCIRQLVLSRAPLRFKFIKSFFQAIASRWLDLRSLDLAKLDVRYCEDVDDFTPVLLPVLPQLESLNLDGCIVKAFSISWILENARNLKELIIGLHHDVADMDEYLQHLFITTDVLPLGPALEYLEINSTYKMSTEHHIQVLFPNLQKLKMSAVMFSACSSLLAGHNKLESLAVYSQKSSPGKHALSQEACSLVASFSNLRELQLAPVGCGVVDSLRKLLLSGDGILQKLNMLNLSLPNQEAYELADDIYAFVRDHPHQMDEICIKLW